MKIFTSLLLLLISGQALALNKVSSHRAVTNVESAVIKQKNHSGADVWLHQLNTSLYQDLDQDGYFQSIRLAFDLDTRFSAQDVFVEVWLQGSFDTQLLFSSGIIHLSGEATNDSQRIDIQLLDDYPADYYQLELIVFDRDSGTEIFSVDQYDLAHLQNLALEGQPSDQHHDVSVHSANLELIGDDNHNGFYDRFSVTIDVDYPQGSTKLVAQFYLDNKLFYTSGSFWVNGTSSSDQQFFDIKLNSGLSQGYYNLDVHLVDADDLSQRHQVLALDWVEFNSLPLETVDDDDYSDKEISVEHHGGSSGIALLSLLLLAGLTRRF